MLHNRLSQDSLNTMRPPTASIDGVAITAGLGSAHSWLPVHNGSAVLTCKGASLRTGGTAGFLAVHLIDDAAGVWYLISLVPGAAVSYFEFDLVGDSNNGTTVTLDAKVQIYPEYYAITNDIA